MLLPFVKLAAGGGRRRVRKAVYSLEDGCRVQRVSCQCRLGRSWAAVRDSIATPSRQISAASVELVAGCTRELALKSSPPSELDAPKDRRRPPHQTHRVAMKAPHRRQSRAHHRTRELAHRCTREFVAAQESSSLGSTRKARRRTRGFVAAPEGSSPHQRSSRAKELAAARARRRLRELTAAPESSSRNRGLIVVAFEGKLDFTSGASSREEAAVVKGACWWSPRP